MACSSCGGNKKSAKQIGYIQQMQNGAAHRVTMNFNKPAKPTKTQYKTRDRR